MYSIHIQTGRQTSHTKLGDFLPINSMIYDYRTENMFNYIFQLIYFGITFFFMILSIQIPVLLYQYIYYKLFSRLPRSTTWPSAIVFSSFALRANSRVLTGGNLYFYRSLNIKKFKFGKNSKKILYKYKLFSRLRRSTTWPSAIVFWLFFVRAARELKGANGRKFVFLQKSQYKKV